MRVGFSGTSGRNFSLVTLYYMFMCIKIFPGIFSTVYAYN